MSIFDENLKLSQYEILSCIIFSVSISNGIRQILFWNLK
jgi:hypothetical protein